MKNIKFKSLKKALEYFNQFKGCLSWVGDTKAHMRNIKICETSSRNRSEITIYDVDGMTWSYRKDNKIESHSTYIKLYYGSEWMIIEKPITILRLEKLNEL